ncbi:MAG: DNA primase [Brevundimonas sp.]|uniref:DNA primase n=1 Tax=Brevundimonas sp. TaxID=1871086 RepID=UPI0025C1AC39|nr:DNA primase [Brevundimonas sp.]MBX3477126.1 DNA primase [Brevundimonas sp.]
MRFDDRYIEELKARLRPSDVIGRSVKLKRQGREYVGLSPFTKEKSPSFFVNDDKGFFHDFSSGKHGDIISFLQETERLSFVEAVTRLATEAGMALPAEDPLAAEREERRKGLSDWMDLAQKWFAANLRRQVGKAAREYLERRGLPEDQWERFGLGYAPNDREGLKAALVQRGAKPGDLVEAGLLIQPEGGGAPYDRFRDRLMFPILDGRGRLVSFGGRAMNPDDRAKYLNGPESPLFHKGATLYGLPEARRILGAESRSDQSVVVVEGYMDVIACQRAGVPAVAPMGTALTEEQMALLWRISSEPVLCFDGDAAGQRAATRAIERALPLLKPDRSFRFARLSGGKDPDDILREQGAGALREQLSATNALAEVLFRIEREAIGTLDTPERRALLKARLRKAAAAIADGDLSQAYRQYLLDAYDAIWASGKSMSPSAAGRALARKRWDDYRQKKIEGATSEGKAARQRWSDAPKPLAAAVAEGLLRYPEIIQEKMETLTNQGLGDEGLRALGADIIRVSFDIPDADEGVMRNRLHALGHGATLHQLAQVAPRASAPFLAGHDRAADREQLIVALEVLVKILTLNRALDEMKDEQSFDFPAFSQLKSERDALVRHLGSGSIWSEAASSGLH